WSLERPFQPSPPRPIPQPEGGGDRNAIPLYKFPATRVTHHFIPEMPLRVSALRALGGYMNVFSIESFVDELAAAAKADPVDFRHQIEGGSLQSLSWTTFEPVMYSDARITSRDWGTYPILRFSHVPLAMEVHVIDRPGEHFLGTGEAAQGPAAGALANALA